MRPALLCACIHSLAHTNRQSILCIVSCHPQAFDELLLLARGGRTIYHGVLGRNSQQLIDYFTATPGVTVPRRGLNPATWMLDISSVGSQAALAVDFADVYAASELCK
jgi:hypothetical protein